MDEEKMLDDFNGCEFFCFKYFKVLFDIVEIEEEIG